MDGNTTYNLACRGAGNRQAHRCVRHAVNSSPWLNSADEPLSGAELDKLLPSTDIIITTPFWPAYLTKDRLQKAKQLELSLTAGVGSDHVDLHTAAEKGITVAEVRYSCSHSADQVYCSRLSLAALQPALSSSTRRMKAL